jgi:hypothetical protein
MTCLDITRAMGRVPTVAIEVLVPLQLEARGGVYRDEQKPRAEGYEHAYMASPSYRRELTKWYRDMSTTNFYSQTSCQNEEKDGFQPDTKKGLILYTDVSKINKGTGPGAMAKAQAEAERHNWVAHHSIPGRTVSSLDMRSRESR